MYFLFILLMYLLYTSDGLRLDFICCVGGKKHFKDIKPMIKHHLIFILGIKP